MKQADGWLLSAFALTGALPIAIIPRALPWAKSFCPFRACGENLLKFRRVIFKMFLSTDKNVFCLLINLCSKPLNVRSKPLNVRSEPLNVRSKLLNGEFAVV